MFVKEEAKTDPRYGCAPGERKIKDHITFGIINLDKPAGPTSHEVVAWVKKILGVKKAGHSGTLDPGVTGVLPTALEKATKSLYALLPAGKEYVGVMHVHREMSDEQLRTVVSKFVGSILQKPPVRSAVKRRLRERHVYSLDILEIEGKDVLFRTNVQAGTYIRKLCSDIGLEIGGAHMAELRRTRAGPFLEDGVVTLHDLKDAFVVWKEEDDEKQLRRVIQPVEAAVTHLKHIWVKDGAIDAICNGANLAIVGISKVDEGIHSGDLVAVMSLKDELVALGNAMTDSTQMLQGKSGWAADTKRVIMLAGTYPRMWKTKKRVEV